jgi:hypothetical protein
MTATILNLIIHIRLVNPVVIIINQNQITLLVDNPRDRKNGRSAVCLEREAIDLHEEPTVLLDNFMPSLVSPLE